MKQYIVTPAKKINGDIRVASDKSISHRAIMLSALTEGATEISNILYSEDVIATIDAMRACGVDITEKDKDTLQVSGGTLREPASGIIDCGNSGTLMRLLSGIAAGQNISCQLTGDSSLLQRPMKRIIEPLQEMNAVISARSGKPPITLGSRSEEPLRGILYSNKLNSAQVKSAILLAGLYAENSSTIVAEQIPSRDHTERMLQLFGAKLRCSSDARISEITAGRLSSPGSINIPADISSAMFFIVAAAISPDSELILSEVGINPTRAGGLDILLQMGADIDITNRQEFGNEPVADIRVRGGELHGIAIGAEQVPAAIDDLPVLMIAAAAARGETKISGAAELRYKESDRLSAMEKGLKVLGIKCETSNDGIDITGKNSGKPIFSGGTIESEGDHRIAMAFTIAALRAKGEITIDDCANVATSFPNFLKLANAVGIRVAENDSEAG